VLFGNSQRLELQGWQPNTARTIAVPFAWKPDTWYRLKLRVENLPGGGVRTQGKAWPAADPEPAAWTLEQVDPIGHRHGSPGIYADAPVEVSFDNLEITPNAATSPSTSPAGATGASGVFRSGASPHTADAGFTPVAALDDSQAKRGRK
jgi:hypothetical protein